MIDSKCKICRRVGQKLFLKGEKCFTPKCPMVKRHYSPGQKGKRRVSPLSEYGKALREKQKLRSWYNLGERQLKRYVRDVLRQRGKAKDPATLLIKKLESRFDNVIFRLGFTKSKSQARQLISHGFFLVNEKKINVPSYQVKKGDIIRIPLPKTKKKIFQNLSSILKKQKPPSWLQLNIEKLEGRVVGEPSTQEVLLPIELSLVFEFYSR